MYFKIEYYKAGLHGARCAHYARRSEPESRQQTGRAEKETKARDK